MHGYTVLYRDDAAGNEVEIELEVHPGRWVPYWPGNHWQPPEGGYVEDFVLIDSETKGEWPFDNLTEDENERCLEIASFIAEAIEDSCMAAAYDNLFDNEED